MTPSLVAIDINADVAEGLDNESRLIPYLSSCSIACGGHAGNAVTMTNTIRLAKQYKVKIGAHPSYPDSANFGREVVRIPLHDLEASITQQVETLLHFLQRENAMLHHIKLHGALYNVALSDEALAMSIVSVVKKLNASLKIYAPWGSVLAKVAQLEFLSVVHEAFIDRSYTYTDTLSLVDRTVANAVIHSPQKAFEQVYGIVKNHEVSTVEGIVRPLVANTFCVHGDNPYAETILKELTRKLAQHAIDIK